jgi:hypothetical protein
MENKKSKEIIDILDSPDVAVWAKGIRKKATIPSDTVSEPSKNSSMTLYFVDNDRESFVDPANNNDVARATRHASLTDEANYGRQE